MSALENPADLYRELRDSGLPLNTHTNVLSSFLVVKSGPGVLYGFTVYNSSGSAQFVQVFDCATVPASGAAPAVVFPVAAGGPLGVQWLPGRTFLTGIVIANSSTADTYTAGGADCYIDAQYA